MPAHKKVSPKQLELLLKFMEANKSIAFGRSKGPLQTQAIKQAWEKIAAGLNAVGKNSVKTGEQWRRYWIEFKARTKTKAADSRRQALATSGRPSKLVPLTEVEQKVVSLIGAVPVERSPAVPMPTTISVKESPPSSSPSTPYSSPTPDMEVEWLEDCKSPISILEPTAMSNTSGREKAESPLEPHQAKVQLDQLGSKISTKPVEARETSHRPQGSTRPMRRTRMTKPFRRDLNVPRWAYDIERRRIEVDMRIARGIENLVAAVLEIKEEIRNYNSWS